MGVGGGECFSLCFKKVYNNYVKKMSDSMPRKLIFQCVPVHMLTLSKIVHMNHAFGKKSHSY